MGLYNKPVIDIVYELINRDNPGLSIPLSSDNTLLLGGPYTTNLGASGRNTRATFNAIVGKGYNGDLDVFTTELTCRICSTVNNRQLLSHIWQQPALRCCRM